MTNNETTTTIHQDPVNNVTYLVDLEDYGGIEDGNLSFSSITSGEDEEVEVENYLMSGQLINFFDVDHQEFEYEVTTMKTCSSSSSSNSSELLIYFNPHIWGKILMNICQFPSLFFENQESEERMFLSWIFGMVFGLLGMVGIMVAFHIYKSILSKLASIFQWSDETRRFYIPNERFVVVSPFGIQIGRVVEDELDQDEEVDLEMEFEDEEDGEMEMEFEDDEEDGENIIFHEDIYVEDQNNNEEDGDEKLEEKENESNQDQENVQLVVPSSRIKQTYAFKLQQLHNTLILPFFTFISHCAMFWYFIMFIPSFCGQLTSTYLLPSLHIFISKVVIECLDHSPYFSELFYWMILYETIGIYSLFVILFIISFIGVILFGVLSPTYGKSIYRLFLATTWIFFKIIVNVLLISLTFVWIPVGYGLLYFTTLGPVVSPSLSFSAWDFVRKWTLIRNFVVWFVGFIINVLSTSIIKSIRSIFKPELSNLIFPSISLFQDDVSSLRSDIIDEIEEFVPNHPNTGTENEEDDQDDEEGQNEDEEEEEIQEIANRRWLWLKSVYNMIKFIIITKFWGVLLILMTFCIPIGYGDKILNGIAKALLPSSISNYLNILPLNSDDLIFIYQSNGEITAKLGQFFSRLTVQFLLFRIVNLTSLYASIVQFLRSSIQQFTIIFGIETFLLSSGHVPHTVHHFGENPSNSWEQQQQHVSPFLNGKTRFLFLINKFLRYLKHDILVKFIHPTIRIILFLLTYMTFCSILAILILYIPLVLGRLLNPSESSDYICLLIGYTCVGYFLILVPYVIKYTEYFTNQILSFMPASLTNQDSDVMILSDLVSNQQFQTTEQKLEESKQYDDPIVEIPIEGLDQKEEDEGTEHKSNQEGLIVNESENQEESKILTESKEEEEEKAKNYDELYLETLDPSSLSQEELKQESSEDNKEDEEKSKDPIPSLDNISSESGISSPAQPTSLNQSANNSSVFPSTSLNRLRLMNWMKVQLLKVFTYFMWFIVIAYLIGLLIELAVLGPLVHLIPYFHSHSSYSYSSSTISFFFSNSLSSGLLNSTYQSSEEEDQQVLIFWPLQSWSLGIVFLIIGTRLLTLERLHDNGTQQPDVTPPQTNIHTTSSNDHQPNNTEEEEDDSIVDLDEEMSEEEEDLLFHPVSIDETTKEDEIIDLDEELEDDEEMEEFIRSLPPISTPHPSSSNFHPSVSSSSLPLQSPILSDDELLSFSHYLPSHFYASSSFFTRWQRHLTLVLESRELNDPFGTPNHQEEVINNQRRGRWESYSLARLWFHLIFPPLITCLDLLAFPTCILFLTQWTIQTLTHYSTIPNITPTFTPFLLSTLQSLEGVLGRWIYLIYFLFFFSILLKEICVQFIQSIQKEVRDDRYLVGYGLIVHD